jgi:hypothetical protein
MPPRDVTRVNRYASITSLRKGSGETFGDTYETGTATRQEMRPTDQKPVGTHNGSKDT